MIKSLQEQKNELKSSIDNLKLKKNLYEKVYSYRKSNVQEHAGPKQDSQVIEP
jgi:hypothetical protein